MLWANPASARAPATRATCMSVQTAFFAPSHYPGNQVNALGAVQGCGGRGALPVLTGPEQKSIK